MSPSPNTWVPDKYQLRARNFLKARPEAGLFLPPGFGKTSIVLSAIKELKRKKQIRKILVVAPVRPVYMVWPEEIPLWEQFSGLTFNILHGRKKDERLTEDVDINIINYDGLSWLASKRLPRGKWDLIVLDESSYIKHPTTDRFRALKRIRGKVKRCWILNGSPISRAYMDLFGQFKAMDQGKTLGSTITEFRNTYFRKGGWGNFKWIVTARGKKKIKKLISPEVFSLPEGEHFELPPLHIKDVWVEFSPKIRKLYDQLMKESIIKVGGNTITAVNAGVLTSKALQFTGGNIYYEDPKTLEKKWTHIHSLKEEALVELLEELHGNPALIGYRFKHELERLEKVLKPYEDPVPVLRDSSNVQMIRDWNEGKLRVMLGYPQVMSHGLNLQKFPEGHGAIIFYTPIHDYSHYDQMIRRIRRRGFNRPVIVYRILAKGTIDEAVIDSLKAKELDQEDFMRHIVNYWMKFYEQI